MNRIRNYAFDWLAWAFFAAIPIVIFWDCAHSLKEQGVASGGPLENAAFFPEIVASILTVFVIWQFLRLVLGRVQQPSPLTMHEGTHLALITTALFIAYLTVLPYAGFHIATPLLCFVLFVLLGLRPLPAILGAAVLWLSTAFIFEGVLKVVLPVGVFNIAIFG